MCQGSACVRIQDDAEAGVLYCVSNAGDPPFVLAVMHLPEHGFDKKSRIKRAACIRDVTPVTISNVPRAVQQKYGVGPTLTALFLPGDEARKIRDYIKLPNRVRIPFNDFIDEETRLELVPVKQPAARVRAPALAA